MEACFTDKNKIDSVPCQGSTENVWLMIVSFLKNS